VLLFTDHVDDFWPNIVSTHKGYDIKSVTKSSEVISDNSKEQEEDKSQNKDLLAYFQSVLGDLVKDIRISKKLIDSPVCLAVSEDAMDMRMERFLIEQKQLQGATTKILEINPKHPIIKRIEHDLSSEKNEKIVRMLFDQACIIEGEPIKDPVAFCKLVNDLIQTNI
jgi:molecular chaperone HtpG